MNERQQSHIDYDLQRLEYWKGRKPAFSTARLLAASCRFVGRLAVK